MKNKLKNIFLIATVILFTACGGGSGGSTPSTGASSSTNSGGTTSNPNTPPPVNYGSNAVGVMQFGLIKNARIEIYKVDASGTISKKPIFKEKTTDGDINHAGFFNTHSSELEDKTYYVYKYLCNHGTDDKDTQDIDTNLDGVEDTKYTPMDFEATSSLIEIEVMVRGEWLKNLDGKPFRITPLLHAIYITVGPSGGSSGLYEKFNNMTKEYIKNDINKDGVIDIKDALVFNPVHNQNDAYLAYYDVVQDTEMYDYRNIYIISDYYVEGLNRPENHYSTKVGSLDLDCSPGPTGLRDDTVAITTGGDSVRSIYTIDIRDPYDMRLLGRFDGSDKQELVAFSKSSRNIVYVDSGSYNRDTRKSDRSFIVLDISDASNPKIIDSLGGGMKSYRLTADMEKLYILRRGNTIDVYSLNDQQHPKKIKTISVPNYVSNDAYKIELSKNKNKLHIISKPPRTSDVSDDIIRTIYTIDIGNHTIENTLTYRNVIADNANLKPYRIHTSDKSTNKEFQFQCSFLKQFESFKK